MNALNRVALIGPMGTFLHSVQRLVTYAPETGEEVITHNYEAELDSPEACQKLRMAEQLIMSLFIYYLG